MTAALKPHLGWLLPLGYLLASALFVLGLKRLSSPATARSGNIAGAAGMLLAIVITLLDKSMVDFLWIWIAMAVGALIGVVGARFVQMTQMPEMVAIFNGFGGLASALVSLGEFLRITGSAGASPRLDAHLAILLGAFVGAVTFTGSLIAFAKLAEFLGSKPVLFRGQQVLNGLLFLFVCHSIGHMLYNGPDLTLFLVMVAVSLALGVLLVIPIGGADMPVIIALLNSYSGIAASMAGFALSNYILIIAGALVGASGLILTDIMCKAMNRSIWNVMFAGVGSEVATSGGGPMAQRPYKAANHDDVAVMLAYAESVVFVPGYGLAVAQAQHDVRELANLLEKKGVQVKYAIHPVAGRMPGHMNVLLAEANVPYPQLVEMEEINPDFERTDVSVVIGANDVVNPVARHDSASPIYGMPILDVDKSKTVVILKRSMRPGFAGVDNDLFYDPRTFMLFGDAKDSVSQLVKEIKDL